MAIKKSNGEGSVYYQKDKNRWRGSLTIGRTENGNLKRKQFYAKTKKEVLERMNDYRYKSTNDLLPTDESMTVIDYLNYWLFKFKINEVKPSTITRYEGIIRNYIKPSSIAKIKLKNLRATTLQSFYNLLLEEDNVTPSNIINLNKVLKSAFSQAIKEGYLMKNYCTLISLPKKVKNDEITFFTIDEQKKFIESCKDHRLESLFIFALGTGLRLGEILALTWQDISFENKTVNINKSIRQEKIFKSDGSSKFDTIIQAPKTESSNRIIPVPGKILLKLKNYKIEQNKQKLSLGELYYNSDLIFATPTGTPINPSNLRKTFNRLLSKANLPRIKFHALRHTYATRLFEQNTQIKTVQALLGHNDIKTTMNIYTHVTKDVQNDAIEKLNMIFC